MDYRQIVKNAALVFIDNSDNYYQLKKALEEIHEVYFEITGVKAFTNEKDHNTYLDCGKAVSPIVAANCLFDMLRTKRFIQGIYNALLYLKEKFKGEKLHIVYAGTGPYGTLLTPLCFLFDEDVFSCTALDIHEESTVALTKVIQDLDIENYFDEIKTCDAFSYRAPENRKPHIIISEVLQMGLQNEPQVALTHHLAPQLIEGGVFIPKEIKIDLYHTKKLPDNVQPYITEDGITQMPRREEVFLGNIYTLNIQTVNNQLKKNNYPNLKFAPLLITIPAERDPDDTLEIQTELEIFDSVFLTKGQSSLTIPLSQTSLRGYENDTVFEFEYKISKTPKTEIKVIRSTIPKTM